MAVSHWMCKQSRSSTEVAHMQSRSSAHCHAFLVHSVESVYALIRYMGAVNNMRQVCL